MNSIIALRAVSVTANSQNIFIYYLILVDFFFFHFTIYDNFNVFIHIISLL